MAAKTSKKLVLLGLLAGLVSALFAKVRKQNSHHRDFRTSTQRMGLSFTDKLRENFRRRWIRPSK